MLLSGLITSWGLGALYPFDVLKKQREVSIDLNEILLDLTSNISIKPSAFPVVSILPWKLTERTAENYHLKIINNIYLTQMKTFPYLHREPKKKIKLQTYLYNYKKM